MAKIDLQNFVNIDIQPSQESQISGTRETVVVFTNEDLGIDVTSKVYDSYVEVTGAANLNAFIKTFFDLGGRKAIAIVLDTLSAASIKAAISELDYKNIMVAVVDTADTASTGNYTLMKSVADLINADNTIYGINEKLLIARAVAFTDTSEVRNLAVKYSNVIGGEASIAAYLSQLNAYGVDTVKDYMFTEELDTLVEDVSNANYKTLMSNNYNVDIDLQGTSRNCGGNCKDGISLTNDFVRIVLQQTLTERLVALLASKIYGANGVGKIYATLVDELKYYQANGYLSREKIWTKDTLIIDGVTIIEKGTPLPNGYLIKIFPLKSEYIANHMAPPIYIVIADQYSIRVINIEGEVI